MERDRSGVSALLGLDGLVVCAQLLDDAGGEWRLADRVILGEGGFIAITVAVDSNTGRALGPPTVSGRGFSDDPKALGEMRPDVAWPAELQRVMDKALARDANQRYRNASEFAHDLVQAIDRMPASRITGTSGWARARSTRRSGSTAP